ncbi:TIGR01457 family HAD-type hydrolase [Paenibacillus sp. P96]|uniref:Acid sugar phosphatase n=1 Tax=Paenibacillus zeirhizosphaerae TaxID=2987519 RepID=A0ABT9FVW1_9BACL|nr:TIGR01457 family HAD-type hydrolase [Paenibacillus sp. P96]MDP4098622.1 TIGR01457 family HAD-type hydrolase [Paenibacillus sp. P96]
MTALLIDLDGTMYHGTRMIEGADHFIRTCREKGIPFLFVTNNSSRTPEAIANMLRGMGIEAAGEEICTSAQAAAAYVSRQRSGAKVYCIGEDGLQQALIHAGLQLVEEQPDYVVQGIDRNFTYVKLSAAMNWIMQGASFIMTNPDFQLPSHEGLTPGAGTIGAAIEAASQTKPVVIGKPSSILMDYALRLLGVRAEQAVVIGDNMLTDIAAGAAAGCRTALVMTGVTTHANMDMHIQLAGIRPDYVCGSLSELWGSGLRLENEHL